MTDDEQEAVDFLIQENLDLKALVVNLKNREAELRGMILQHLGVTHEEMMLKVQARKTEEDMFRMVG